MRNTDIFIRKEEQQAQADTIQQGYEKTTTSS